MIAGRDPYDATSADIAVPKFETTTSNPSTNPTIGVPWQMLQEGVDPAINAAFFAAIDVLKTAGARIVDISLPHAEYAVPVYYLIAPAEASSNLARYDGVRYAYRAKNTAGESSLRQLYNRTRHDGFGDEVKRRIMLGTYALSAGYYDAYYLSLIHI